MYSRIMSHNKIHTSKFGARGLVYLRGLLTAIYNTHVVWRLFQAESYLFERAKSYRMLRANLKKYGTMQDSILAIITSKYFEDNHEFLSVGSALLGPSGVLGVCEGGMDEEALRSLQRRLPKRRRKIENYIKDWNSPIGIKRRTEGTHTDVVIGYTEKGTPRQKWCKLCSYSVGRKIHDHKTTYQCETCFNTPLRRTVRRDARGKRNNIVKICFERWHEGRQLTFPTPEASASTQPAITD